MKRTIFTKEKPNYIIGKRYNNKGIYLGIILKWFKTSVVMYHRFIDINEYLEPVI